MDDLISIGEFSNLSGLSAKRLRTYATDGLLIPAAVDPTSGYRYYSRGQLPDARVIDALRRADVSLAEIHSFLRGPSEALLDDWEKKLQVDARQREGALAVARQLITPSDAPAFQADSRDSKEANVTTLRSVGRTDIGRLRENNEDVIVSSDRLALVADGMGGHPGGEVAARIAAGVIPAVFTGRSVDELEAAIRAANWAIRDRAAAQDECDGMGTTVCAAGLLANGQVAVVHVGDSRAFLWHEGALTRLTRDHSVTAELVQRGELRMEEARQHPHYGVLTRALGVGPDVNTDHVTLTVGPGDRILLCTDGLFNELSDREIEEAVLAGSDLASLANDLVDMAVMHGGRDNVSVVLAEVA